MIQEFHNNNPQAVGPVKATLAAIKLPPAHKIYALEALPGGGKSLLPKKESNDMAIVFPFVAWPKPRHLGKPSPKPHPFAAIWVMAQEIGSEWSKDAPSPISPL
ncbi:hypothetical protein DSO57_1034722 [Entomophthora muscae]|uniref:Uncharacterized protein n=1 Tax=Entomophthora muscae TaxID=34485 RepID=A0ACC2RQL5_9FUNG|nr:hypothetical protein DSO57_1034722 [Entomophthora muscae]